MWTRGSLSAWLRGFMVFSYAFIYVCVFLLYVFPCISMCFYDLLCASDGKEMSVEIDGNHTWWIRVVSKSESNLFWEKTVWVQYHCFALVWSQQNHTKSQREREIKAWHLAQGALQSMIRTFAPCLDMLIKVFMVFKSPDRSWQWEMWSRRWPRRYYQWPPRVFQRNWSRAVKLQGWCHWRLTLQGTNMEM